MPGQVEADAVCDAPGGEVPERARLELRGVAGAAHVARLDEDLGHV